MGSQRLKKVYGMATNRRNKGAALVEYVVLLGALAVLLIGPTLYLGYDIAERFEDIDESISSTQEPVDPTVPPDVWAIGLDPIPTIATRRMARVEQEVEPLLVLTGLDEGTAPLPSEVSWTLTEAPAWLSIDSDGTLTGEPPATGTFTGVVTVEREGRTAAQPVTITVRAIEFRNVTDLFVGRSNTCAIADEGALFCWGANVDGAIVLGTATHPVRRPTVVVGMENGVAHAAPSDGSSHMCAVKDGSAYCWGNRTNSGAIGDGVIDGTQTTPYLVHAVGSNVVAVGVGNSYSCAHRSDGEIWCWGSNFSAQLGRGGAGLWEFGNDNTALPLPVINTPGIGVTEPADPSPRSDALAFDTVAHSCFITTGGDVRCWGNRIGVGRGIQLAPYYGPVPPSAPGVSMPSRISTGNQHTCVVVGATASSLSCWGFASRGQISVVGNAIGGQQQSVPTLVPTPPGTITDLHANWTNTCIVVAGVAYCSGENDSRKIDAATAGGVPMYGFTQVSGLPATPIEQVRVGADYLCVLTQGEVWCKGEGTSGNIGNNAATDHLVAVQAQ
jgi:alpha-tubulin suppressor-like RCC1 family protein/Flp pilus assembly pilin Flp